MQKISKVILKNFKFFKGEVAIDFERKNMLLYGENGSGKSSIYWALYTFLQSVFKSDPLQIRKYFDANHSENLINRFAPDTESSSISVQFEDENRALSVREISLATINTRPGSPDNLVLDTVLGSDFIDHKILSRVYSYYHKESIDLFDFFEHHLLSFINFRQNLVIPGQATGNANSEHWWNYIKKGLDPHPNMRDPIYTAFQTVIREFNIELGFYLEGISERTNIILKDKFQEKFKIRLTYKDATYNAFNKHNKGRNKTTIPPQIILSVELLTDLIADENRKKVTSPQSFLNEAKLSTMALAMRLAIIDEKFVAAYPKVLVLDDVLLSMDMSNREFVLGIMLEYTSDFQLLFFTHQRGLFEDAKKQIESFHFEKSKGLGVTDEKEVKEGWKKHWKIMEMYESENADKIPIPQLQESKNSLQKALYYLKESIDYSACGNNLRAALEEYFREFIPKNIFRNANGDPRNVKELMLHELLQYAGTYFTSCNYDIAPLIKLDRYRERSLNPASHYNPKAEFYKRELQEIFSILDLLKRNKRSAVIRVNDQMKFQIRTAGNRSFSYTVTLLDEVSVYNRSDGNPNYFVATDIVKVVFTSCLIDGVPQRDGYEVKDTLQGIYNRMLPFINRNDVAIVAPDIYQVFTDANNNTLENLKL